MERLTQFFKLTKVRAFGRPRSKCDLGCTGYESDLSRKSGSTIDNMSRSVSNNTLSSFESDLSRKSGSTTIDNMSRSVSNSTLSLFADSDNDHSSDEKHMATSALSPRSEDNTHPAHRSLDYDTDEDDFEAAARRDIMETDDELLVSTITGLIDLKVQINDRAVAKVRSNLRDFESDEVLPVSVHRYIKRIRQYTKISANVLILALIYLNRLKKIHRSLKLTSNNIQRLYLVACLIAAKYLEDHVYSNKRWANVGDLSLKELNHLEACFLFTVCFDLKVSPEEYRDFLRPILEAREAFAQAIDIKGKKTKYHSEKT